MYQLTAPTGTRSVGTTDAVREALKKAWGNPTRSRDLPPLEVVTIDHYNTKWAVVAIEWLRRRKIADHILQRPHRVCIEVLESGMLPRGRFGFYNGVGGALADMIAHLLQPLRALTGLASVHDLLANLRLVEIKRARYKQAGASKSFGPGSVSKSDLESTLMQDTETFGVIKLQFTGPPWPGTPVFIRTGKGFVPQSKTIVAEGFDDDGPVALICDIDHRNIRLAVPSSITRSGSGSRHTQPDHVWIQTQEIPVPGLVEHRPITTESREYVEVFGALCHEQPPDPRFFPGVEEAAAACDFFYRALLHDRARFPTGLTDDDQIYEADYIGAKVREWFADEADWS